MISVALKLEQKLENYLYLFDRLSDPDPGSSIDTGIPRGYLKREQLSTG